MSTRITYNGYYRVLREHVRTYGGKYYWEDIPADDPIGQAALKSYNASKIRESKDDDMRILTAAVLSRAPNDVYNGILPPQTDLFKSSHSITE